MGKPPATLPLAGAEQSSAASAFASSHIHAVPEELVAVPGHKGAPRGGGGAAGRPPLPPSASRAGSASAKGSSHPQEGGSLVVRQVGLAPVKVRHHADDEWDPIQAQFSLASIAASDPVDLHALHTPLPGEGGPS
jgi:hypothetical protein